MTLVIGGSITQRLVSSLTGLESVVLVHTKIQHIFSFGQMQSRQTGDQRYSDPSPYGELSELANLTIEIVVYTLREHDQKIPD